MERKQLMERLELMKKEFAKKQRKLEKAKRAAQVKAHVRKKIEELNLQARDDQHSQRPVPASSQNADIISGQSVRSPEITDVAKQPSAIQQLPHKNIVSNSIVTSVSTDTSSLCKASLIDSRKSHVEDLSSKCGSSASQKTKLSDLETELQNFQQFKTVEKSHEGGEREDQNKAVTGQDLAVVSDIEDSLAITPTFKSLRDTCAGFPDGLGEHPELSSFPDIGASLNTFTLNLHSETSLHEDTPDPNLAKDWKNTNNLQSVNIRSVPAVSKNDSENVHPVKTKTHQDEAEHRTVSTHSNASVEAVGRKEEKHEYERTPVKPVSPVPVSKPEPESSLLPDPVSKHEVGQLRLQDISSQDDAAVLRNDDSNSSVEVKACHDDFLDYTELDAIPFSQFELTEDFLSECSQHTAGGSQNKSKRKGISSLVQRRSPRLSSFEFDNSSVSSEKQEASRLRYQQTALYRMARKQKKSKKAMFISSLFQYLIDEAKRDAFFVEFKLPADIANTVSCSLKGRIYEGQPVHDLSHCTNHSYEQSTKKLSDTEVIPETEVDPDFVNDRISDGRFQSDTEESDNVLPNGHYQSDNKASLLKAEMCVTGLAQSVQDRTEISLTKSAESVTGVACGAHDRTESSMMKAGTGAQREAQDVQDCINTSLTRAETSATGMAQQGKGKRTHSLSKAETNVSEVTYQQQDRTEASSDRKIKSSLAAETLLQPSTDSADVSSHCKVCAYSENQNVDREMGNCEMEKKVWMKSKEPATDARETTALEETSEGLDTKTKLVGACPDTATTDSDTQHMETVSTDSKHMQHCSAEDRLSEKNKCLPDVIINTSTLCGDQDSQREEWKPVLTSPKIKSGDEPVETADQNESQSWIEFVGCVESGCTEAVVDMIVGTVLSDVGEMPFILCVQATALTLWTQDDDQQWSAEFHWYLPKANTAAGACRIHTADKQLAVLVWGFDMQSVAYRLTLTVFVYDWDTHHTQRFSVPPPSPVCPDRVFCHGLESSENSVLVFTTDKAFTVGRRYSVDRQHSCVSTETVMKETNSLLTDLCLVQELADAVTGFTVDRKVLIWNCKSGALIISLSLPDNLFTFSRMYTCYSFQGYLLLHMTDGHTSKDMCLIALNPMTGSGKMISKFTVHNGQHTNWLRAGTVQDILLTVSSGGTAHVWDACCGELLSINNPSSKIQAATMLHAKNQCLLLTGQDSGCVHLFSVSNQ